MTPEPSHSERNTSAPERFDIRTCETDFAGPGRKIVVTNGTGPYCTRRQMKVLVNDWTISCVWGFGTYCTAARPGGYGDPLPHHPAEASPDAEVAVWRKGYKSDEEMIDLDRDTVAGWRSPADVLAAIAAAERDDENGIRAALTREAASQTSRP